jgi:non-heme chloroperoxidase
MTHSNSLLRRQSIRLPGGVRLTYAEQGPRGGTTLLLLHGITDSWRSFEPLLPWLPTDWHVIALSQRGHGDSDHGPLSYRTQDFAADAAALLTQLALAPAIVVGHSMGAANAMQLAGDRPELVRAVVGIGAFAQFADKAELAAFHASAIAPLGDVVPRALAQAFQQDTIAGPVAPGLLETMVDECLKAPAAVWRAAFAGLFADSFVAALPRIAAPVLLAWGDADAFVPRSDQDRLLQALRQAQLSVYRGTGHAVHWEQPERVAADLVRFAASLPARAPTRAGRAVVHEKAST